MLPQVILIVLTAVSSVYSSYEAQFTDGDDVRPCRIDPLDTENRVVDIACIAAILSIRSSCDPRVYGSVPNVVRYYNVNFEAPISNASFYDRYVYIQNIDQCTPTAFFIERNRNRGVLAITCPNLRITAKREIIQHYPEKEDRQYCIEVTATYPSVIFTVDMPNANELDICENYVFPYVTDLPTTEICGTTPSSFPWTSRQRQAFVQEYFSEIGGRIFRLWVNSVLCNFDEFCED